MVLPGLPSLLWAEVFMMGSFSIVLAKFLHAIFTSLGRPIWHLSMIVIEYAKSRVPSAEAAGDTRQRLQEEKRRLFMSLYPALSVFVSVWLLSLFPDISKIYHVLKSQQTVSTYFIFHILVILYRMFVILANKFDVTLSAEITDSSSCGHKCLPLFALLTVFNTLCSASYVLKIIVVSINISSDSSMISFFLYASFDKMKSVLFKKYSAEGLYQISVGNVMQRFNLFITTLITLVFDLTNLTRVGWIKLFLFNILFSNFIHFLVGLTNTFPPERTYREFLAAFRSRAMSAPSMSSFHSFIGDNFAVYTTTIAFFVKTLWSSIKSLTFDPATAYVFAATFAASVGYYYLLAARHPGAHFKETLWQIRRWDQFEGKISAY